MADSFDLQRFVEAQDRVLPAVMRELGQGRKQSHWMWFVFPQLRALGRSPTALHYGITSLDEARAYMAHAMLGPRLVDCAKAVLAVQGRTAHEIFGSPDDLKLRSCMTLFAAAAPEEAAFAEVLRRYYGGEADPATLRLLAADSRSHESVR